VSPTAESPVAEPPTAVGTTYVYGIVPAGAVDSMASVGVRGSAVAVLEEGGVAALVSDLGGNELRVTRKDLRRHLEVVDEAFRETTILPCPFGTTVESREAVVEDVLRANREALVAGLTRLEGTVQLNVKVSHDEDALLRQIVASDPAIAHLRQETAGADGAYGQRLELGQRVAAAVEAYRAADGARVLDALAAEALDVAVEPDDALVLKAAVLVARERQSRFDALVDRVAAAEQELLRFEVIGPLAPTAFVERVVEWGS
jgi:hypothetical protein